MKFMFYFFLIILLILFCKTVKSIKFNNKCTTLKYSKQFNFTINILSYKIMIMKLKKCCLIFLKKYNIHNFIKIFTSIIF